MQTQVNNAVASITQEVADRKTADTANADAITQEVSDRAAAITQEITDRTNAVQAEADARLSGIQQEASDRADAISAEATARGAAITTETNARQAADSSLSTRIDTNTAAVGTNTAAIQTEQTARVAGDSSEANQRETLATQMRGDYTGNDLSQVSTGLIASERSARTTQYESIAQQMTLLSAGVGEQFDYAKIWYFTNDAEGWTGSGGAIGWSGSWIIRPYGNTAYYLLSPAGLAVNGAEYTQARLRVRKVGNPTWRGLFGLYAPGATGSNYTNLNFAEPAWDANGIGVVMVDTGYTGTIDQIICILENAAATATDHYEIDWVTVGRPAPGASSAALANEGNARAAADIAEATARQTLSVKLVGQADPTGVTLGNVASGLIADEKNARASADGSQVSRIATMEARMPTGTGALATSASVSDEASARTTADTALSTRTSAIEARVPAGTDQLATAASVASEASARTDADGALSTRIDAVTATANNAATQAALTAEQTARADGDSANAATSAALQASLDTTNANVTAAQTTATNAASAAASAAGIANSKGKVLIQSSAPAAADQLAQNLWIDTTNNANTPKKWSGSAWVAVTDKAATDAAAAAVAAQNTANAAQQAASTNATAISSTNATVTQQGTAITANTTAITGLQSTVGNNTSAITAEQTARATGDAANASAISSLQASSNAQFDSAKTWNFDATMEGWNGGSQVTPGWLKQSTGYVTSPRGLGIDGPSYPQARLRIRKNGNPPWGGLIGFYLPGATGSNYTLMNLTQPVWDANGIGVISVEHGHTGIIDGIILRGYGVAPTGPDFYDFDWISVGRQSPSASNADITSEATTRASADSALSTQLSIVQATANAAATGAQLTQEATTRAAADTAMGSDIALLGAHNAGKTAFVLNQDTVQVDGSTSFAQMLTGINATASANTSAASAAQTSATNAANAAAAASGIANGKADVLIQSAAPSAAMQKATTLWIDTTGNTNTPKRWSGSAWVAVTDKAATDAASAAAAAQATANAAQTAATQAQANINSEATTRANADTALGQRIDTVNATVGANTAAINTEQTARASGDSANAAAITSVSARTSATENVNPNLLANPTARIDLSGWITGANAGTVPSLTRGSDSRGTYFDMQQYTGGGNVFAQSQEFSVLPSEAYTLSADLYCSGGSCTIGAVFFDVNGAYIGENDNLTPAYTGGFTRNSGTVVTPSNCSYMRFRVISVGNIAEMAWKNCKAEFGSVATPYSEETFNAGTASATQQLTAGTTIGGAAYAAATVMVDANGHIGGTRLASDGTTSSFAIVADQFQIVSPSGGARTEYSSGNWRVYDSAGTLRVALGVNI